MHSSSPKNTVDRAAKVQATGLVTAAVNGFVMFAILLFEYQSGGHGEMGRFYHDNLVWTLLVTGRGLATGIVLLRAWRWARISTLIFSALLAAFGVLAVFAFLRATVSSLSDWKLMIARTAFAPLFLVPIAAGLWWLVFFTRKEVKAYFKAPR